MKLQIFFNIQSDRWFITLRCGKIISKAQQSCSHKKTIKRVLKLLKNTEKNQIKSTNKQANKQKNKNKEKTK